MIIVLLSSSEEIFSKVLVMVSPLENLGNWVNTVKFRKNLVSFRIQISSRLPYWKKLTRINQCGILNLPKIMTFPINFETDWDRGVLSILQVLCRFLITVKNNYRRVIYHNWRHAFNVTQSMFAMLTVRGFICVKRWFLFPWQKFVGCNSQLQLS